MQSIRERWNMSKAEKFIKDCTRNCSNELIAVESRAGKEVISYHEWLTPDQALRAVEIARDEVIEEICEYLSIEEHIPLWDANNGEFGCDTLKLVNNLKQAMKDERI